MLSAGSIKRTALALAAAIGILPCATHADVFSLWPTMPSGKSSSWPGGAAADALNPKKLWTEPLVLNGVDSSMGIALVDSSFESCVFQLRSAYPKASFAGNGNSLLMEAKLESGRRMRLFVIQMPGIYPVIQFTMEVPEKIPTSPKWPSTLPLPSGATPITVMEFPKRGSSYGFFSCPQSKEQASIEMKQQFVSSGWRAMGSDTNEKGGSSGDVFIHSTPPEIAIVGVSTDEAGQTRGSVYSRKTGK